MTDVHDLPRPWLRVLPCPCGAKPVGFSACCGMFLCGACYQIHSDERLDAAGVFTGFDGVRMSWPYWIKSFFWRGAYKLGYMRLWAWRRGYRLPRDTWLPVLPESVPCPGYEPR